MKLWIDDDGERRRAPPGWKHAYTLTEALVELWRGNVTEISFDHDLGGGGDAIILAKLIAALAQEGEHGRIIWHVHSANIVGAKDIHEVMTCADKFWDKHEENFSIG